MSKPPQPSPAPDYTSERKAETDPAARETNLGFGHSVCRDTINGLKKALVASEALVTELGAALHASKGQVLVLETLLAEERRRL